MSSSEKYKGYDQIINIIPELKTSFPKIRYLLAGKYDKSEIKRIKRLVKKHDCADQVTFLGFIPDEYLSALFSLADVFVMPSKKEGFGIVFIEAMACGIPVIGGNADGTSDALKNGELGKLINPDSSEDLKNALIDQLIVSENRAQKQELQKKANLYFGYPKYRKQLQHLLLANDTTLASEKIVEPEIIEIN
jgi:glycosyltransferase involved in cell wall biosynthesis